MSAQNTEISKHWRKLTVGNLTNCLSADLDLFVTATGGQETRGMEV